MIDFIQGKLSEKSPARVVLETGGVGYEVFVSLNTYGKLPEIGRECRLMIYDYLREDQHLLFGFWDGGERRLFTLLLNVTGIGPKIAMSIMSGLAPAELAQAIVSGDLARLSSISGVGRKTAERLVVELRDKLAEGVLAAPVSAAVGGDQRMQDAARALVALGYKPAEAQKMVALVIRGLAPEAPVEDIIRLALRR